MKKRLTILLLLLTAVASCDHVFKVEVPYEGDKLVVNSFFHPDSVISLTLSHSNFILEDRNFEKAGGATAILLNKNGVKLDKMAYAGKGIYKSNIKPEPGKIYKIKVSKEGYETVTAFDKVPEDSAHITRVKTKLKEIFSGFMGYMLTMNIWLDDPQGDDYYELVAIEKVVGYDEEQDTTIKYIDKNELFLQSHEAIFHDFQIGDPDAEIGRYAQFKDDLFNGSTIKITVKAYIRFKPPCFRCSISNDSTHQNKYKVLLYLKKTSRSYYKYKRSVELQNERNDNPFAEPVTVYDNIKNGLGIFAGFNVAVYPIKLE